MANRSDADDESQCGSKITSKDLTDDFDSITNISNPFNCVFFFPEGQMFNNIRYDLKNR